MVTNPLGIFQIVSPYEIIRKRGENATRICIKLACGRPLTGWWCPSHWANLKPAKKVPYGKSLIKIVTSHSYVLMLPGSLVKAWWLYTTKAPLAGTEPLRGHVNPVVGSPYDPNLIRGSLELWSIMLCYLEGLTCRIQRKHGQASRALPCGNVCPPLPPLQTGRMRMRLGLPGISRHSQGRIIWWATVGSISFSDGCCPTHGLEWVKENTGYRRNATGSAQQGFREMPLALHNKVSDKCHWLCTTRFQTNATGSAQQGFREMSLALHNKVSDKCHWLCTTRFQTNATGSAQQGFREMPLALHNKVSEKCHWLCTTRFQRNATGSAQQGFREMPLALHNKVSEKCHWLCTARFQTNATGSAQQSLRENATGSVLLNSPKQHKV